MESLREPTALRLFLLTQHRAEVRWVYLVTTITVLLTILGDLGWVGSSPLYLRLPQLLLALTGIRLSTLDIRWHRLAFDAGLFLFLTFDVLGNQRTSPDPDLGLVGCTLLLCAMGIAPLPAWRALLRSLVFLLWAVALSWGRVSEDALFICTFSAMVGFLGAVTRYTSLRALWRSEQQVTENARRAEAAAQARAAFVARISHEIRTPLGGTLGMIDLLEQDGPLNAAQQEHLQVARASGQLLLALVNDVLDFSRGEQRGIPLSPIPTDLRKLIAEVLEVIRATRPSALEIRAEVDPRLPQGLLLDPARVRQLLFNLVGNAVKFTPSGEVVVRVGWSARLSLAVWDTGIGIPEDTERLFQAFEQADGSITRRFGGSGLGLAITRQIVEAMGGTITAQRRTDGSTGSVFAIDLPCPPSTAAPEDADAALPPLQVAQVPLLLVEDNPINQLILRRHCEAMGFRVEVAADGQAGLAALRRGGHQVVLMDHHMPTMSGLEATRLARAAGITVPIIGVTASVLPEDLPAGADAGMDAHVSKPIDPLVLQRTLQRVLAPLTSAVG